MPRPNRYHPYTRNTNHPTPRYTPAPTLPGFTQTFPATAEQPLARPYQYIYPGYIRATTSDGKTLVPRSVVQSPDGVLHVQMQIMRFPSEDAKFYAGVQMSGTPSPPLPSQIDPSLSMWGATTEAVGSERSKSGTSRDSRNMWSVSEECAIVTDDEDAEGEIEDVGTETNEKTWGLAMEQREISGLEQ